MATGIGRIETGFNPHSLARTGAGKGLRYSAQWFNFVSFLGRVSKLELTGMRALI
jgi:hypothetical protein